MITEAFQLLGSMSCRSIAAIRLSHPAISCVPPCFSWSHRGEMKESCGGLIQVKQKVDSLQNLCINHYISADPSRRVVE